MTSAALSANVAFAAMSSQAPGPDRDAFAHSLRTFSRRGSMDILDLLLEGPARFSEIRRSLPDLGDRLMWERLRELTDAGLITREVDGGPPITSTYSHTPHGAYIHARLRELRSALHQRP